MADEDGRLRRFTGWNDEYRIRDKMKGYFDALHWSINSRNDINLRLSLGLIPGSQGEQTTARMVAASEIVTVYFSHKANPSVISIRVKMGPFLVEE